MHLKKILVLYFSGVGSTKRVAELICSRLLQDSEVDIFSVESKEIPNINNYNALVVGTPTYHAAPAKVMMNFLDALPPLSKKTPAFVYNTRGLCSLNTNRILAKELQKKNITTIIDRAYRGPASDGSILAPFIKRFFEFDKDICKKINCDCTDFIELLKDDNPKPYIPRFQLGSIINAPNKAAGQLFTFKIYLHKDECCKCEHCIKQCPHSAISADSSGYPLVDSKKCGNCYRCMHHCPNLALSLRKRKK